jgi:CrcB protein
MQAALLVALGGAVGSLGRYWATLAVARWWGEAFPWSTLMINVLGSFVIGAVAALTDRHGALAGDVSLRLLLMVGLCGGFTTFSSFSLQTLTLLRNGDVVAAGANVVGSVLLCLLATALGVGLFTRG